MGCWLLLRIAKRMNSVLGILTDDSVSIKINIYLMMLVRSLNVNKIKWKTHLNYTCVRRPTTKFISHSNFFFVFPYSFFFPPFTFRCLLCLSFVCVNAIRCHILCISCFHRSVNMRLKLKWHKRRGGTLHALLEKEKWKIPIHIPLDSMNHWWIV